ncbi:hypothetical protein BC829DRAFT_439762 [Chytridium lagenaria]|nr:hypothetical protein BC829DRAFT_439762 [Chytridium lagenaria]
MFILYILLPCLIILRAKADQSSVGDLLEPTDLQGTWSVEENIPSLSGFKVHTPVPMEDPTTDTIVATTTTLSGNASLHGLERRASITPCKTITDVSWDVQGNVWRRNAAVPDRFNSNGRYYIRQVVKGSDMDFVKFRVFVDLVDEMETCVGYTKEGGIPKRVLISLMNTRVCVIDGSFGQRLVQKEIVWVEGQGIKERGMAGWWE